eukprot:c27636_g1_i1.p1 GENE.c27636_g1_i1~~c27636_g1_i1.p1  ORF type:complete len:430 (+),score=86.06 c27636_g1_i1:167-1456(+)
MALMMLLFVPFFIAPIYRRLPSPQSRYSFDIIVGTVFLFGLYGTENAKHFYGLCLASILLMNITGRYAPVLVSIVSFAYLSARHITRYLRASEETSDNVDITGPMMVPVLKVISMPFNFRDGGLNALAKHNDRASLFATCGYLMQHSTLIIGPPLRLDEYCTYASLNQSELPDPSLVAIQKFLAGLVWFLLHVWWVVLNPVTVSVVANPETAWRMSLWTRLAIIYWVVFITRLKFYAAWLVCESSLNLAGWGYNPETNKWSEVANVHPLKIEFGQNARQVIVNWNIRVSEWLRAYVQEKAPVHRDTATLLAFFVSSAWHGFSIGQYVFFFFVGVYLLKVSRVARKAYHPIASARGGAIKLTYDIIGTVLNMIAFSYFGVSWVSHNMAEALAVWRNTYYIGFVGCGISWAVSTAILATRPRTDKDKTKRS